MARKNPTSLQRPFHMLSLLWMAGPVKTLSALQKEPAITVICDMMRLNTYSEWVHYVNRRHCGWNYLVMVLDAHADCIDEDGDHNPSIEVLAFNYTPKLHSYFTPNIFTFPKTSGFPLRQVLRVIVHLLAQAVLIPVALLQCTLHFLPIGWVPRQSRPLLEWQGGSTLWTLLWVRGDRERDCVLQRLGGVVQLGIVITMRRCETEEKFNIYLTFSYNTITFLLFSFLDNCHAAAWDWDVSGP